MPNKLKKFSPLSETKIQQIVRDIPDNVVGSVATKIEEAKSDYAGLIRRYQRAEDKKVFLERNIQEVAYFLNDSRLLGVRHEDEENVSVHSFTIGAEGLSIISAYLQNKDKYADLPHHQVQVVKNEDLKATDNSKKIAKIALEKKHVHSALCRQLQKDLTGDETLEKTYVVETLGTTGGNHVVTLTILKEAGNNAPTIHLFDPSPALARNGVEAQENSIAGGWCAQIAINATLKRALADAGLQFDTNKYYNNSEPLQKGGPSLCGTFSLEEAHHIARGGLNFSPYIYESAFGGKTEIPVRELLTQEGYIQNNSPDFPLRLRLPADVTYISHFTDTSLRPREQQMNESFHVKKSDLDEMQFETVLERVKRYQTQDGKNAGENEIAEQKSLRQKYGHLFEIVISDAFEQRAGAVDKSELVEFEGNPYFQGDKELEISNPQTAEMVSQFNKILPRTCRVSEVRMVGDQAEMMIYIGNITASKIANRDDENSFGYKIRNVAQVRPELVDFSGELLDVDPHYSQITKLTVGVQREKFEEFSKICSENGVLYKARDDYPFTPPKTTIPLGIEKVKNNQLKR